MRKFLKINDAAVTSGVKDTLLAVDDMLSVADGTGALDFKFKHPQGGAAGVTSFSLGLVAGETAEGAINSILEEFAVGKELMLTLWLFLSSYGVGKRCCIHPCRRCCWRCHNLHGCRGCYRNDS